MRVLITGALGFVGSHLADAYLARGDDVYGIDNHSGNVIGAIDGMQDWNMDVRDIINPEGWPEVDLVVHAASPVGPVALLSRESIVAEIIESTQAVLRFCEWRKVPLINISTSEVYGFSGTYRETDACRIPHRLTHRIQYAAGKLAAEHLVRTSPVESVTVRPFNVAGPRQDRSKGFVLPTFCEQALAGEKLTVFDRGDQERALTAVWDIVDFILSAKPSPLAPVVNVGNPGNRVTVLHLAHRVETLILPPELRHGVRLTSGKEVHGPDYEEAEGVVKVPDITEARAAGWKPRVDLDELILRTAAEIRQTAAA
jgi:UDP-glucose 4-epimerase